MIAKHKKPMRRILCLLLILAVLAPLGAAASASEEKPMDTTGLTCAQWITDTARLGYVNRMLQWYLSDDSRLEETLKSGQAVVMLFEGASDRLDLHPDEPEYRQSAVCIVLKYSSADNKVYIDYFYDACTTMPDYPLGYSYDNGHPQYGTATVLDGIYDLYTVNHRGQYAAFHVCDGTSGDVPAVYPREDGGFAQLNANGVNIHTRGNTTISPNIDHPKSAGCLLVGSGAPYDDFSGLVDAVAPDSARYEDSELNSNPIRAYQESSVDIHCGMLVIDRYLYREQMLKLYGEDAEAIACITAFSTAAQYDTRHYLSRCTFYDTYLNGVTASYAPAWSLPADYSNDSRYLGPMGSREVTVNGICQDPKGDYWYRVNLDDRYGYIRGDFVKQVIACYDDISIHGDNAPTIKRLGSSFSISGVLASTYNQYSQVQGRLVSRTGQTACFSLEETACHSYSLKYSQLDNELKFGALELGAARYQVSAQVTTRAVSNRQLISQDTTFVLVDEPFRVASQVTFGQGKNARKQFTNENNQLEELPTASRSSMQFLGWYHNNRAKAQLSDIYMDNTTLHEGWALTDPAALVRSSHRQDRFALGSHDGRLLRGDIAGILWCMEGCPDGGTDNAYADNTDGQFFSIAFRWCQKTGIVPGRTATVFGGGDCLTRSQVMEILYRYAAYKGFRLKGFESAVTIPADSLLDAEHPGDWVYAAELISQCAEVADASDTLRRQLPALLDEYRTRYLCS